jgi:hypothetical protein
LRVVPEHSENTTTSGVERRTSASLEIGHGTARVITVRAQAINTDGVSKVTPWLRTIFVPVLGGGVGVQLALSAGTGVQCVLIDCPSVHELDDIDLMEWVGRG